MKNITSQLREHSCQQCSARDNIQASAQWAPLKAFGEHLCAPPTRARFASQGGPNDRERDRAPAVARELASGEQVAVKQARHLIAAS